MRKQNEFEFVLPVASTLSQDWLRGQLEMQGLKPQSIHAPDAALKGRSSAETLASSTSQGSTAGWSRPSGLREDPKNTSALAAGVKTEAPLIHLTHNAPATLMHSRAAVVASGTATVEAALSGTPFIVVYRLAPLTWLLGRRLVKLDTFAMPNLIAGKKVVPELIQKDFTAQNVFKRAERHHPGRPRSPADGS